MRYRAFLSLLSDASRRYFLPFPAQTDFVAIYGCLRLSHEYDVPELRQRALVHLSSRFRTSLASQESIFYRLRSLEGKDISEVASWDLLADDYGFLICLAQLAREVEAQWVLPSIFYQIVVANLGRLIYHGVESHQITASLSYEDQNAVEAGVEATAPGQSGFADSLQKRIADFYQGKHLTLIEWGKLRGVEFPPDFFEHPSDSALPKSVEVSPEGMIRRNEPTCTTRW